MIAEVPVKGYKVILHHSEQHRYSGMEQLPCGRASENLTQGCLVLEGGAWRGLYTQGVLDALMEEGINFQSVAGISAGALAAMAYLSGQIGFSIRINLGHRMDKEYCGRGAMRRDHGITGFSYFYETLLPSYGFDQDRFLDPARDLTVAATNIRTGRAEYFHKGECDIFKAIQASATVPYISKPVQIGKEKYLDGGCALNIPLQYELSRGHKNIVVIRTRDKKYRAGEKHHTPVWLPYASHPELQHALSDSARRYNLELDEIDRLESEGRIFVLAPQEPVIVSRFEGNLEKLGDLYWKGYRETCQRMGELKAYLECR